MSVRVSQRFDRENCPSVDVAFSGWHNTQDLWCQSVVRNMRISRGFLALSSAIWSLIAAAQIPTYSPSEAVQLANTGQLQAPFQVLAGPRDDLSVYHSGTFQFRENQAYKHAYVINRSRDARIDLRSTDPLSVSPWCKSEYLRGQIRHELVLIT